MPVTLPNNPPTVNERGDRRRFRYPLYKAPFPIGLYAELEKR